MDITIPLKYNYQGKKLNYIHMGDGNWIIKQTGKEVDPMHVPGLETNAEKRIMEYNARNLVKIGEQASINNIIYTFNGTDFVDKDGNAPFSGSQTEKIKQRIQDASGEKADDNSEETDSTGSDDKSTNSKDTNSSESKNKPESNKESSALQGYADMIKDHPKRARLITLIGRGDPVSLLAVDIILSGKEKEAEEIIKNMN